MKSDQNGCSTCAPGQEQWEKLRSPNRFDRNVYYQYDYRTLAGELFSCVAPDLEIARQKRDKWLMTKTF